jgi:two-component system cell cycle sensor histidine kinase/response regulator CckA
VPDHETGSHGGLSQHEERLRHALDLAGVGVFDHDHRLGTLWWSGRMRTILGVQEPHRPSLELFTSLIHPDDRLAVAAAIQRAHDPAGEGRFEVEHRIEWPDGTIRWLRLQSRTWFSDERAPGPVRTLGTVLDITRQKQDEAALREQRWRLEGIIDGARVGTWEWNVQTGEAVFNARWAEIVGHTLEEVQPVSIETWTRLAHPEDLAMVDGLLRRHFAGEVPYYDCECRMRHKDGTWIWVHDRGRVVQWTSDGRPLMMFGTHTDITDRKQAEAERTRSEALLAEQLRQAQKMEALGQLAGGVAHDFNNLLTIISGYAELLLGSMATPAEMRHDVEEIRNAGEKAALLTSQLLAFSRKQVLQPRLLDLSVVIEDSRRLLRRVIGEDVQVAVTKGTGPLVVRADHGQLSQVLVNLALNAREAMPSGGSLAFDTSAVVLAESDVVTRVGLRPGRYVVLTVNDTGAGIEADAQAHVFEPFFTTKPTGKGTGLGLAVVHGIVAQSGGHIEFDSHLDVGTTFRIYLPAASAAAGAAGAAGHIRLQGGIETILVVEDEDAVRSLTRQVLSRAGYHVLAAADPVEALRIADAHHGAIDLLVTDVVMPGSSGVQLAERFRARYPDGRVLFVSGYTPDAVLRHGVQQGELAFLQKPFSPSALAARVREVLDSKPAS